MTDSVRYSILEALARFRWYFLQAKGLLVFGHRVGIIGDFIAYRRIQAARPGAAIEHIPERNTMRLQRQYPLRIRHLRIKAEQGAHDGPEAVTRVTVVLLRAQRSHTGHAAQHQYARIAAGDRSEAMDLWRFGTSCHGTDVTSRVPARSAANVIRFGKKTIQ